MGIANRDKDASEKIYNIPSQIGAVSTAGVSIFLGIVPSAGQVLGFQFAGKGLSGTPSVQLAVNRWTTAGITAFAFGSAVTLAGAFGLSGGVIGATYNSASYAVQAGDLLVVNAAGANTAVTDAVAVAVISATQDIKQTCGI
jgi:hypothetical protein